MIATETVRPFTGRKMLMWIISFFAVVIAANLIMMTFALTTHTGLVVPNSYVASQDFNREAAAARAQMALGWRTGFAHRADALELSFADATGAPILNLDVVGVVGRPVTEADDRQLTFKRVAPGVYRATATLGPGEWRLEATAAGASVAPYRQIRTFVVARPAR